MTFVNTQIPIESLPSFSTVSFTRLDPRYARVAVALALVVELAALCAAAGVISLVLAANPELSRAGAGLIFGGLVLGAGLLAWFVHRSASVIRYAVREHDVIVQSGVFWRKETVQPVQRIQHVEQHQGPIDRRFGLYELKLFSAGTGHFTFRIPGLDATSAGRIKQFLLAARQTRRGSWHATAGAGPGADPTDSNAPAPSAAGASDAARAAAEARTRTGTATGRPESDPTPDD